MHKLPIRILLSLAVMLGMLVPFFVTAKLGPRRTNLALVRWAFHAGCVLWGIKVKTEGRISGKLPLLVVSNHFSYTDVFALASVMKVRFTPKSDVAAWPVIGFFCTITGCLFIDRRAHQTMKNKTMLENALRDGGAISLFPEGTTGDGAAMLPFKSSFFSIAWDHGVPVQPVSIVYTKLNGEPVTPANKHIVGWYGKAEFFPHLVTLLQQKSIDVTLVFHEPVESKKFTSRKELAQFCQGVVANSLSA